MRVFSARWRDAGMDRAGAYPRFQNEISDTQWNDDPRCLLARGAITAAFSRLAAIASGAIRAAARFVLARETKFRPAFAYAYRAAMAAPTSNTTETSAV